MKKLIIAALAAGLIGASAQAQTNQVLSRNAVGYVKVTAPSNSLILVRNDFESLTGGSPAVSNLIGTQVPVGASLYIWDRSSQQYRSSSLNTPARGGWGTFGTNQIKRGESFFLRIPSAAGISNQYEVYLMGEVPDSTTAPTTTVTGVSGLGMWGHPYPVATQLTNIGVVAGAAVGDTIYLWSVSNQNYASFSRNTPARGGWGGATNVVLNPGEGFWLRSSITQNWSTIKPYTWP